MRKNRIRITESDLHGIVKEAVNGILNEHEAGKPFTEEDTFDAFRENVYKADGALYNALTFINDPKKEVLVKNIQKAYDLVHDAAYFLSKRK